MDAEFHFTGRVWKFGDNINTDALYPSTSRRLPEAERYFACMEPIRPGWSRQVAPGDILVGGRNFGCGSSRPAPENLSALKISCAVVDSVARIFFRNAISLAFPVLVAKGIAGLCEEGHILEVDLMSGLVVNRNTGEKLQGEAMPPDSPPIEILRAGGILPFLRRWQATH